MAGRFAKRLGRILLPRRQRSFVGNESGATMIEFGILSIPFFAILGAILETSIVFLSGQVLESAVQDSGRIIRTGQAQGSYNIDNFREDLCGRLFGLYKNCAGLHIQVSVINNFASANYKPPVDANCKTTPCDWTQPQSFTPGVGSDVIVVQAYYRWPLLLNLGVYGLADLPGNQHLMAAVSVFRNEPFNAVFK